MLTLSEVHRATALELEIARLEAPVHPALGPRIPRDYYPSLIAELSDPARERLDTIIRQDIAERIAPLKAELDTLVHTEPAQGGT